MFSYYFNVVLPLVSTFLTKMAIIANCSVQEFFDYLTNSLPLSGVGFFGEQVTLMAPDFLSSFPDIVMQFFDIFYEIFSTQNLLDMPLFFALLVVIIELFFAIKLIKLIVSLVP